MATAIIEPVSALFFFPREEELLPTGVVEWREDTNVEPLVCWGFFLVYGPIHNFNQQLLFTAFVFVHRCGLRDVPTFVANFLMPFGNIVVCFQDMFGLFV